MCKYKLVFLIRLTKSSGETNLGKDDSVEMQDKGMKHS